MDGSFTSSCLGYCWLAQSIFEEAPPSCPLVEVVNFPDGNKVAPLGISSAPLVALSLNTHPLAGLDRAAVPRGTVRLSLPPRLREQSGLVRILPVCGTRGGQNE